MFLPTVLLVKLIYVDTVRKISHLIGIKVTSIVDMQVLLGFQSVLAMGTRFLTAECHFLQNIELHVCGNMRLGLIIGFLYLSLFLGDLVTIGSGNWFLVVLG